MTGSRKTRIRLAVFFLPFFPSGNGRRIAFFQADARFHGADSGDGQYQRFTLLAREQAVLANQGVQVIDQLIQPGSVTFILCWDRLRKRKIKHVKPVAVVATV